MIIRDPDPADETAWRALWAAYIRFYHAEVAEEVTAQTWRRILDPDPALFCRVAAGNGRLLGFAVCVVHPGTWSMTPSCYLEDLFVAEAARGKGIGAALIDDLVARGRAAGWRRLYWHTYGDNRAARRLYDRYAAADGFVRYDIDLR